MHRESFTGVKVLIMGLGLNGGGLESARYLARSGADVTVTDLRDKAALAPSIEQLRAFPIRYVLGRHDLGDFRRADMLVKNPSIRADSPYLKAAHEAGCRIETDISLFLAACPARILAVTGTKGKSSTASALHWALSKHRCGKAWLGGNITVSPLSFLDKVEADDDVVLELSSFQLGDLRGRNLLKPRAAIITCIMRDHLDMHGSMRAYVDDKRVIYHNQSSDDVTIARDDEWGMSFHKESKGHALVVASEPLEEGIAGGWIARDGTGLARIQNDTNELNRIVEVVPKNLLVTGSHQRQNLLAAALALIDLGLSSQTVRESLSSFPGIEHRLEFFIERNGVRFYNDSAATIPEAAAAAVQAFQTPGKAANLVLIAGGTDKDLDFTPLALAAKHAKAVILLAGSGTAKLQPLLEQAGVPCRGPFDSPEAAAHAALEAAASDSTVLFSPGCTSFGMFLNEFDRGRRWKAAVKGILGA